jgi:hypothetical protein
MGVSVIVDDIIDVALMITAVLMGTVCLGCTVILALCPPHQLKDCLRCRCLRHTRPRTDTQELDPIIV